MFSWPFLTTVLMNFFYGPSRPLRYFKIGRKVKLKLREKQSYMKIKI